MRAAFQRWRAFRQLRRERNAAFFRWRLAHFIYQDTAAIYRVRHNPAALEEVNRTQEAAQDALEEYLQLKIKLQRAEERLAHGA